MLPLYTFSFSHSRLSDEFHVNTKSLTFQIIYHPIKEELPPLSDNSLYVKRLLFQILVLQAFRVLLQANSIMLLTQLLFQFG